MKSSLKSVRVSFAYWQWIEQDVCTVRTIFLGLSDGLVKSGWRHELPVGLESIYGRMLG